MVVAYDVELIKKKFDILWMRVCILSWYESFFFYLHNILYRSWQPNRKKFWPLGKTENLASLKKKMAPHSGYILV